MKTLYESILDDEDVLIDNTIKDAKNPFITLANLMDNGINLIDYKQEIEKIFGEFVKTIKSKPKIEIITQTTGVMLQNRRQDYDALIIMRFGHLWDNYNDVYGLPGDQKMVIFFSEPFMEDYVHYGFKNETDYMHWVKMIVKKYNLNKSKKDILVYYI